MSPCKRIAYLEFHHVNNISPAMQTFFWLSLDSSRLGTRGRKMSGIEAVKIIVDAEKEASKILAEGQAEASRIRKQLDSLIEAEREKLLQSAKAEASTIIKKAEEEGGTEAVELERNSQDSIRQTISQASTRKATAVTKLVRLIVESER